MRTALVLLAFSASLCAQDYWTQLSPATSPPIRTEVQMVSDGTGALMFGGLDGAIQTAYNDLWRFDGTNWTQLTAQGALTSPPARSRYAGGYDPIRNRFVIFGGSSQYTTSGTYGDTWEYDPVTNAWTQMLPLTSPGPRVHSRMAFDLVNLKLLMFGGSGGGGDETWHWDGTDWALLTPNTVPMARQQMTLATNWSTGQVFMFGGQTSVGITDETWTWDGFDWTQVTTATSPGGGGIRNSKVTYDQLRDRMVVFGGVRASGGFSDSIWEFDGVDWTERLPATRPAGRAGMGFCFVTGLSTAVMFAGYNGSNNNETWTWQTDAPASVIASGAGCPTSAGIPTLAVAGLPWAGETVDLTVGNAGSGLPFLIWSFSSATTSLAPFGFPACSVVSQDAVVFAPGPVPFAIPNTPVVAGFMLSAQAAAIDPSGPGIDLGLSDVQTLTIGTL